ncbi:hypothetical protein ACFLQ0_05440 [Nitrospinota bacterium]
MTEFLSISERISVLPVIHGSGDFTVEVRDRLLRMEPDCVAVPIPPSFQEEVEAGILDLPSVSMVAAEEPVIGEQGGEYEDTERESWEEAGEPDEIEAPAFNFVPIDPCQPVIAALRTAMEERIARAFVDMEVASFAPFTAVLPDPYALKKVSLEAFAASLLMAAPPPRPLGQREARIRWMAGELLRLEKKFERTAFVCSAMDWPWIRQAYQKGPAGDSEEVEPAPVQPRRYPVDPETLAFVLGELPFITWQYEKRREELRGDRNLSIDGVKELILESRAEWLREHKPALNWVTPQRIQIYLQYVRNLTLQARRLTPDLFTLVVAAKQVAGDAFALTLAETARRYPYQEEGDDAVRIGIGQAEFPEGPVGEIKNRLGGSEVVWKSVSLKPRPRTIRKQEWRQRWNPFTQCSWPPEDTKIESFHTHVREQAKALLGQDLARSEKFTTSIKDGLDMRETLRNWHTGDLYVKEIPPARGSLEIVIFLFDTPADPEKYSWRTMWFAEHEEESTLCMYATPFEENIVGPGVAQSTYGGAFFLFPPRHIEDVWRDPRFGFAQTVEERLIAGACFHSQERAVALVSPVPPLARWRRIARMSRKTLVHIPLGRFSRETVERIRRFHVLNGREVRSYAARFIREV